MFQEHEQIVLTDYVVGDEGEELNPGDVGCVVHIHPGGEAMVVEFMSLGGETIALATVLASQARSIARTDITHARNLSASAAS